MKKVLAMVMAAAAIVSTAGCRGFVLKTVMGTVEPYFHGPGIDGAQFKRLTEKVYTFRWNWYRNIVIVTGAGLVVIDPMNAEMSTALRKELDRNFPGQKVHTLIYSHYHLDHSQGGEVLTPANVIAHEKYGQWHGFNEMFVLNIVRDVVGEGLGY